MEGSFVIVKFCMFIIDVSLKHTPVTLSVQRKSAEDTEAVYQQVLAAMQSGSSQVIELTCDRQPDKKIAVLSSEIAGVQTYEKSTTSNASGRPPGFFALAE